MVKRPDILSIGGDGFPDHFHFRVVPLECLIVALLTRSHLPVARGHLFLELVLASGQFFEDAFYPVKPLAAAVGHFHGPDSSLSSMPRLICIARWRGSL